MPTRLAIVRDPRFLLHKTGLTHPESVQRLEAVHHMLDRRFPGRLPRLSPALAAMEQLQLAHQRPYLLRVLATAGMARGSLAEDTPCHGSSYLAAWLAAGGCLAGLERLAAGELDVCLALVRPPGHHALAGSTSGFCILNNLAVAARWAVEGLGYERVLIVDWDVHHGNGLQEILYRDRSVLYFSSHYMGTFPGTGAWDQVGQGPGRGYNLNLELPMQISDQEMVSLYAEVLGRVMRRFRPQLILVAAGFDAIRGDPLGRLRLSPRVFGRLTALLREMGRAHGSPPWLLALEGGYDPEGLAESVGEVVEALLAEPPEAGEPPPASELVTSLVQKARAAHAGLGVWV